MQDINKESIEAQIGNLTDKIEKLESVDKLRKTSTFKTFLYIMFEQPKSEILEKLAYGNYSKDDFDRLTSELYLLNQTEAVVTRPTRVDMFDLELNELRILLKGN